MTNHDHSLLGTPDLYWAKNLTLQDLPILKLFSLLHGVELGDCWDIYSEVCSSLQTIASIIHIDILLKVLHLPKPRPCSAYDC